MLWLFAFFLWLLALGSSDFLRQERDNTTNILEDIPSAIHVEDIGNLLTNGGAESGNVQGWSVNAWSTGTSLCYNQSPRRGTYAFTTSSTTGSMSQTISVTPGSVYTLSMYIEGYFCSGSVSASVDGTKLIAHNAPGPAYTYHTATFTAQTSTAVLTIYGDVSSTGLTYHGCCVVDDISVVFSYSGPTLRPVLRPTAAPTNSRAPTLNLAPSPTADPGDEGYFYVSGVYNVGSLSLPVPQQCFVATVTTSGSSAQFTMGDQTSSSSAFSSSTSSSSFSLGLSGFFANILGSLSIGHSTYSHTEQGSSALTRNYNFDYSISLPTYSYHNFMLSNVGKRVLQDVQCDPVAFAQACGNAVPLSVTYSATVNAQLSFTFAESSYLQYFTSSWSGSGSLKKGANKLSRSAQSAAKQLSLSVGQQDSNSVQSYTSQSSLTVAYSQFGGPPIEAPLGLCSLDNVDDCIQAINTIIKEASKSFSKLSIENAVPTLGQLQDVSTVIPGLPQMSYSMAQRQSINRAINWIQNALDDFQTVWSDMNNLLSSEQSLMKVVQAASGLGVTACSTYQGFYTPDIRQKISAIISDMQNNILVIKNFMTSTCLPDLISCENNIFSFLLPSLTVYLAYNLFDNDFQYAFSPAMSLNRDYFHNQVWIIPTGDTGQHGGTYYFIPIVGTGVQRKGYSGGTCAHDQTYKIAPLMQYASDNSFRATDYSPNSMVNPLWNKKYACSASVGYYNDMNCLLSYVGSTNGAGANCANGLHVPGRQNLVNSYTNQKYYDHSSNYGPGCGDSISRTANAQDYGPLQMLPVTTSTPQEQCSVPEGMVGQPTIANVNVNFPTASSATRVKEISTWIAALTIAWVSFFLA